MALTIATGFVVDDAFVVLENISRHTEAATPHSRGGAARRAGVWSTVLSISLSSFAVLHLPSC